MHSGARHGSGLVNAGERRRPVPGSRETTLFKTWSVSNLFLKMV